MVKTYPSRRTGWASSLWGAVRADRKRESVKRIDAGGAGAGSAAGTSQVALFGRLRVTSGDRVFGETSFPSRKARHVFELLALAGGAPVSKDHLIEVNWGDRLPRYPAATLEHTVSILRSACAEAGLPPLIATTTAGYRLDTTVAVVDLARFDHLVRSALPAEPVDALRLLREALALVAGEVLENEPAVEWAIGPRNDYRQRVERAALRAARLALAAGDAETALGLAEHAQRAGRLPSEDAYHLRASALARLGRRTEALALLRDGAEALTREFGTGLSGPTQALEKSLRHPVAPTLHPRRVALDLAGAALPEHLPFLGRDRELARVAELFDVVAGGGSGVLVVEAPAGFGKSRLVGTIVARGGVRVHRLACSAAGRDLARLTATRLHQVVVAGDPAADRAAPSCAASLYQALASALAGGAPTVVAIDDVHFADDESLAILAGLAGPNGLPGVGIVATRPPGGRGTDPLGGATVTLGLLDDDELAAGGCVVDRGVVGGVPLALAACVEAQRTGGLSAGTLDALVRRAASAGALAQEVLVALAAAPAAVTPAGLAFALGLAPDLVHDAIDELERHGLLAPSGLVPSDGVTAAVVRALAGDDRVESLRSLLARLPAAV